MAKEEQINFIALSKTSRYEFSFMTLKNLCDGHEFIWHSISPHGRSGGILLGADMNYFGIGAIDERDFYVKFLLRDKLNGFKFALYLVMDLHNNIIRRCF